MLKNWLVRKHHPILTLLEILCPLGLFYFLAYLRNRTGVIQTGQRHNATIYNYTTEADIINFSEPAEIPMATVYFGYAPVTPFTTEFIRQFNSTALGKKMAAKYVTFNGFESETEFNKFLRDTFKDVPYGVINNGFGIIFENLEKDSSAVPKNFKYKIRNTHLGWSTDRLFPSYYSIVTGPGYGGRDYMDRGFLAFQMAIDQVYMNMANPSRKSNFQMVLQRFPYPPYIQNDLSQAVFLIIMPICTMLSFVLICPSILKRLVEEKNTGVKELMKLMGLDTWLIWAGWLVNAMMVYTISVVVITVILCGSLDAAKGPVITYVHWSVVFVFFFLFCAASVCFIFSISSPFTRPNIAMCIGILVWVLVFSFLQALDRTLMSFPTKILLGMFFPLMTIFYGFEVTSIYEGRKEMLTWTNLFDDGDRGHGVSMGIAMLLFICNCVIHYLITMYIDAIKPGSYGIAKPWYFMFEPLIRKRDNETQDHNTNGYDENNDTNYERPQSGLKVGLRIQNLRKVFGSTVFQSGVVAVDKVNLDVYQGEITALLGHNGAGKTTTMSMITGMFSPSSGSVYFKGYNIFDKIQHFRSNLGLCPQANMLFSYLNVIEHLIFFGMLKGLSYSESQKEGLNLLSLLNMKEKKTSLVSHLSGGMKRKLSLAIALIGKPEVLMLDEPTSGMDPESRREMWDILSGLRGDRIIMITTHYMEEADVLGDRIAIMDHGRVSCYGTTLFLKKLYGTGYSLTIMKDGHADAQNITSVIRGHIPSVEVKSLLPGQVTYNLPQESRPSFSTMFEGLEARQSKLGIKGVGIAYTSMEEVFLRVGGIGRGENSEADNGSTNTYIMDSGIHKDISSKELTYNKVTGLKLVLRQFWSLFRKKQIYCFRKWLPSLIFLVMPLLCLYFGVRTDLDSVNVTPLELSLDLYGETPVYISADPSAKSDVTNAYVNLINKQGSSPYVSNTYIIDKLLAAGADNVAIYRALTIVAAEFSETSANGLYSSIALHAAPISLNLISNALLQSDPATSSNQITVVNHPIDLPNKYSEFGCGNTSIFTMMITSFLWVSVVPIGLLFLLTDFIAFPNTERVSNAKQLQLMSGVSPPLYWLATFVWDYIVWLVITVLMLGMIYVFDRRDTYWHPKEISIFLLIVLLFGVSGIVYTYFFSYLAKTSGGATCLFLILNLILGLISAVVMYVVDNVIRSENIHSIIYNIVDIALLINPYYTASTSLMHFAIIAIGNRDCTLCFSTPNPDCVKSYLVWQDKNNTHGLMKFILFLAFDWIIYLVLILLIDYSIMSKIKNAIMGSKIATVDPDFQEDTDVRDERDMVIAARNSRGDKSAVVMTVDGLAKKFNRNFVAVHGISFQVSAGECFGILGVNGAGKTTTFRMLTGDELPTAGGAYIYNYSLAKNRAKFLEQIGYCPQFDGINEVLTGQEMLQHFAAIRGIPSRHMKKEIDDWIKMLGLEEYRHRRCGTYSGGNKRKLSTAMALVGDPPLVCLDEPTSGVDPVARRNLWNVLIRCQKSGQAIVLTSHSMEECEALCARLTILVQGRMMCIGSTQHLKTRYGQGYTIMMKLHSHSDSHSLMLLPQLKQDIETTFRLNCFLKDEHQGFLHYHLPDNSIPLSRIFSSINQLKERHAIIEDYSVADTTLEQVFLAFAKDSESAKD